jgi:hypothetical protein
MTQNQKYRASGTDLSFKDWIEMQKTMGSVDEKLDNSESENANFSIDYKGIGGKQIAIAVGVLVLIGVGIWAYKKYKK